VLGQAEELGERLMGSDVSGELGALSSSFRVTARLCGVSGSALMGSGWHQLQMTTQ
jgi:hypothetical protein